MEAVVYTSNTGSTEHYAKLLGHELEYLCIAQKKLEISCQRVLKSFILDGSWQERYKGLAWQEKNIRFVQYVQLEWDRREHSERRYGKRTIFRGKIPVFTL